MPKPVLQAMVLADHAYQDRQTGKVIIAGTFGTLFIGQVTADPVLEGGETGQRMLGPVTKSGSPYLYLALVGVHGQLPLSLKFVDLDDATVLFDAKMVVASSDPVALAEFILALPELPVSRPGSYSLDLLYNGEILGSWRVAVRNMDEMRGESVGDV